MADTHDAVAPMGAYDAFPFDRPTSGISSSIIAFSILHHTPLRRIVNDAADLRAYKDLAAYADLDFPRFCSGVGPQWQQLRGKFEGLRRDLFLSRPSGSSPFIRMLRDHWLWQWYETLQIARRAHSGNVLPINRGIHALVESAEIVLGFFTCGEAGGSTIISGPEIFSRARLSQDKNSLEGLVSLVHGALDREVQYGALRPFPSRVSPTLYSQETLLRAAMKRYPRSYSYALAQGRRLPPLVEALGVFLEQQQLRVSFSAITRLAALISTCDMRRNEDRGHITGLGRRPHDLRAQISGIGSERGQPVICRHRNGRHVLQLAPKEDNRRYSNESEWLYESRLEVGVAHWRNQVHENLMLLNNWLNRQFGASAFLGADTGTTIKPKIGLRLARFIGSTFNCSQVAIYRAHRQKDDASLECIAAITNEADRPAEKMVVLARHMAEISGSPAERPKSIAYRSFDENRQQYVKGWHSQTSVVSVPHNGPWSDWGMSVVATPIRVNGVPWGVLECAGSLPDGFSALVRSEIEELSSILSPFFFLNSVVGYIKLFTSAVASAEMNVSEKIVFIEGHLKAFFMCSGCGIFSIDDEGNPSEIASSSQLPIEMITGQPLREVVASFLVSEQDYQVLENDSIRRKVSEESETNGATWHGTVAIVRLQPDSTIGDEPTALVLCFPSPISREFSWLQTYSVLGAYVLSILQMLRSEVAWTREFRPLIAHQLTQHAGSLMQSMSTLGRRLTEETKNAAYITLFDMEESINTIRLYAAAMSSRDLPSLDKDLRLSAIVDGIKNGDLHARSISLRDAYNVATQSRRTKFSRKQMAIGQFRETGETKEIWFLEGVFSDILGAILDNVSKYAASGSLVRGESREFNGYTQLRISNIGPLLSRDEVDRIFEMGFRGDYARAHLPKEGSGLGLGYAQSVMHLLGGELEHQQILARTSLTMPGVTQLGEHTFTFTFPLKHDVQAVMREMQARRGHVRRG